MGKKKICIINGCCAYGGPERLIEDWISLTPTDTYDISYILSPYEGFETHRDFCINAGASFIPAWELIPLFFHHNLHMLNKETADETLQTTIKKEHAFSAKKVLTKVYKFLTPKSIDERLYYKRSTQRALPFFERYLMQAQPDVIHLNIAVSNWLSAAIIAIKNYCPNACIIGHFHNPPIFHKMDAYDKRLIKFIQHPVFVSAATAKQWAGIIDKPIVLHNAVRVDDFQPVIKERRADKVLKLGACSRLSPMKALDIALRAMRQAIDQGAECTFDIVGTGPEEENLKALSAELELEGKVNFHGYQQDVKPYLSNFDLYIQSSRSTEGLPISLLESMAMAIPSVVTDIGGMCEAITHNENGFLVEPENPTQLAELIVQLHANPEQLTKIGIAARQRVEKDFDMHTMVKELNKLYEQS